MIDRVLCCRENIMGNKKTVNGADSPAHNLSVPVS